MYNLVLSFYLVIASPYAQYYNVCSAAHLLKENGVKCEIMESDFFGEEETVCVYHFAGMDFIYTGDKGTEEYIPSITMGLLPISSSQISKDIEKSDDLVPNGCEVYAIANFNKLLKDDDVQWIKLLTAYIPEHKIGHAILAYEKDGVIYILENGASPERLNYLTSKLQEGRDVSNEDLFYAVHPEAVDVDCFMEADRNNNTQ
jgi:hypothetical protein